MTEIDRMHLVSCVSKKSPTPAPAREFYASPWFLAVRRYVEAAGDPWFVLSAKYGSTVSAVSALLGGPGAGLGLQRASSLWRSE
jgi:hypothetical protein